ncbi:MAG: metal-sensitive transcriptional regulator [Actinobacteria bacterium]|nr:metal-sensitive transcriptional regulator [Actinomycetota bacterium]
MSDPGYAGDRAAVLRRLARIEGQVRGIQRMVSEDSYCIDVLTQVSAVKRALDKVTVLLVADHLQGCVLDAANAGDGDAAQARLDDATEAIGRLLRS